MRCGTETIATGNGKKKSIQGPERKIAVLPFCVSVGIVWQNPSRHESLLVASREHKCVTIGVLLETCIGLNLVSTLDCPIDRRDRT